MNTTDTLHLALRNLRQSKLRTALTTLGVSIGIASLAGMVSLGVGLQEQTVGRFLQSGVFDSVTVTPARAFGGRLAFVGRGGAARRGGLGASRASQTPATPEKTLDDNAIKEIAAVDKVKDVYPNIRVPVDLQFEQFAEFSTVSGVPLSAKGEGAFQSISFGTFFPNDTDNTCLLSLDLAKRMTDADPKTLIGKSATLAYATAATADGTAALTGPAAPHRIELPFRIVGIVERAPNGGLGGGFGADNVMIPLARAEALEREAVTSAATLLGPRPGGRTYTSLTVKVTHAQFTQDVEDRLKALGYSAFSLNDALAGAKRAFIVLDIILSLIGSIALAVSSLGIVNTMVMSILERTREIGIMKAIGGSDADVRRIFLVEASAIGVLGGVTGVLLGWLVGRIINIGANFYIESQGGTAATLFSLPWWLIGGAIGFSWVVSLIAGSYPAGRAARLNPIQALRHD